MVSMDDIKTLRAETGAGVMDAKRALEDSNGDMKLAKEWIMKKGLAQAEKKSDRETAQGALGVYVHHDGKKGAMVKLLCETDFVARTDDFTKLAKELALHATSMEPEDVASLLAQPYVRDPKVTVEELIKQTAAKLGEHVQVGEFVCLSL